MIRNYILFSGGIFNEKTMLNSKAISPASNRWQSGLIQSLANQLFPVSLLSHLPEPIWPKGHYKPGNQNDLDTLFDNKIVRYWNLPFLRNSSLSNAYVNAFKKICFEKGTPSVLITYNPSPFNVQLGLYAQNYCNVPWVSICADYHDPGPNWSKYAPYANEAKGHIFLSYHAFQDCPFKTKLHLDGGIKDLHFNSELKTINNTKKNKVIVYTGMLTKWGGLDLLLGAFKKSKDPNIELLICGHGSSLKLKLALKEDSRISFFGLVSEPKLREIYQSADIFVNPRPSNITDNNMNFPSKLLEYLSYGKPVISTFTLGLSPKYNRVLEILDEETEECLRNKIEFTLKYSNEEKIRISNRIRQFLLEEKTWTGQSKKLTLWLKENFIT